jgi:undecaprenyl-diphosphatase
MDMFQAILLGLIQGGTEFIPVSSSGHLVLIPWLLRWESPGLVFDTVAHWGTLLAVLAYFWRDWWELIVAWLRGLLRRDWKDPRSGLMWLLILGSVPAAVIGYLFESFFESLFGSPQWASVFLLVTAAVLAFSEWQGKRTREVGDLRWPDALVIGVAQAVAIAPGISRSGMTMAAGLLRGLRRQDAARFSFLLATPVILGAGLFKLLDVSSASTLGSEAPALIAGFVAAAISGFLCIRFLLRYLQRGRLYPFAVYCTLLGLLGLVVFIIR